MLASRSVWIRTLAILTVPFVALAFFVGLGAKDRIDRAEAAADDLDGIFPFATVAGLEGSLHEEGSLAIALAVGLIEADEFGTATAATDAARVELIDELTYHEPDSAIGRTLGELETGMATIADAREQLLAGTFEGQASDPYRAMLESTGEASRITAAVLFSPMVGAVALANLDAARSASGDAVFESTASIFEASGTEAVADALMRLDAADLMLQQTASPDLAEAVTTALASSDATLAADGASMIAEGEVPDLFAWADATPAWVLAYGDPEGAEIETTISIMELRAERAEHAALEFVIVAAAAWVGLLLLSVLVVRSILGGRVVTDDKRTATVPAPAPTVDALT